MRLGRCTDAPTLVSSFAKYISRGDGGKKARSPRRARRKPLNPLRRECRVIRWTCGDYARVLFSLCTRGCGCIGRPAFPTPSDFQGERFMHTSGASRRGNAKLCLECTGCLKIEVAVREAISQTHSSCPDLIRAS